MKITDQVTRVDAVNKINGSLKYLEDITFDNLHYARTLRSTISKGKIVKVNYPQKVDGITIIDKNDILHLNEVAMIEYDMPIFADKEVNYIGEPIALIVGENKDEILEFFNRISVDYIEDDTSIFTIENALAKKSIFTEHEFSRGDLDNLDYDFIFEKDYETGYQEQLYMEKQGVVGDYSDGILTIYGSLQCPYYVLNALKHGLGLDSEHLRVIQTPTGGAFGGKEEYPSITALQVGIASMKVKYPVRLIFDRREDMSFTTKRHPSKTHIKTYIKNSKMVGIDVEINLDSGPYIGLSDVVLQRALFTLTGCYNFDNLRVKGKTLKTNNIFTGAFRGFGAPQSMFALEHHINQIAKKLSIDPIEFRREYFVKKGGITSTKGIFNEDIFLDEIADKLIEMTKDIVLEENEGLGVSFIPHGGGFTGDGEASHIKAVVKLKKDKEGLIHILVSNVEMGQGAITALSKIVASVLDISIEDVIYSIPDTFKVPDSGPTAASRTTMVVGKLLFKAAERIKEFMDKPEEVIITENFKQPDYIKWDQEKLEGNAYMAYSWSGIMAKVKVDPITFEVSCTDIYGVYDVGIPIDEKLLLGQIHGGVVQGLGYGLLEEMKSKNGKIEHFSFSSYLIPTTVDAPNIHAEWIINRFVDGPFGAKSVGELTLVGVAPAVASAIENAINRQVNSLPITPEKIMEA